MECSFTSEAEIPVLPVAEGREIRVIMMKDILWKMFNIYIPIMANANRQLQVTLERDILQRDVGTWLEPSILFSRKPVIEAFFQSI